MNKHTFKQLKVLPYTYNNRTDRKIVPENHNNSTYIMVSGGNEEANAEFIVRACNSYDELLAVCKKAVDGLNEYIGEWQAVQLIFCNEPIITLKNIITEIEQAIEKAEGKQ